jgi:uncharacterized protein (TIGR03083 family)
MEEPEDLRAGVARFLSAAEVDARALLQAVLGDWSMPVPQCPAWDAAGLVRHMGGILQWMAAIVTMGERVSFRTLGPSPEDPADLPSWYLAALPLTLDVLGSADPGAPTWTFSSTGDRRVWWWCRRLAVEVGIHRWDAEQAAAATDGSAPGPVDAVVATAGIEEFILEFLPGLLGQEGVVGLTGTLHLHATDGPTEWWIDLNARGSARPEHARADTAVRGTRSDLLLWLLGRRPLRGVEVLGNQEIADRWGQLHR